VTLEAVYSSPLSRAVDTAAPIAARHGLSVVTLDALKEIGLGVWEGLTFAEVALRDPERLAARRRDPLHVAPDGGETILDVCARALPALSGIAAAHPNGAVAVVAHGAVNKAILLHLLGLPLEGYRRMQQDNGALNLIEWDGPAARVLSLNETAHLDGASRADSPETQEAPPAYMPRPRPE
jgi:broad specificity phosphatase PhoE